MPDKKTIIENLNWTTSRISDRVWTVSVGILVTCISFVIEGTASDGDGFLSPARIAGPACLAILSLVCDLLQYVAADYQNRGLLKILEEKNEESGRYPHPSVSGTIRRLTYNLKILFCVASAVWIGFEMARATINVI